MNQKNKPLTSRSILWLSVWIVSIEVFSWAIFLFIFIGVLKIISNISYTNISIPSLSDAGFAGLIVITFFGWIFFTVRNLHYPLRTTLARDHISTFSLLGKTTITFDQSIIVTPYQAWPSVIRAGRGILFLKLTPSSGRPLYIHLESIPKKHRSQMYAAFVSLANSSKKVHLRKSAKDAMEYWRI